MNKLNQFFILFIIGAFAILFLANTVYAAPPDSDNNGCVSLGEISAYVASWLNGGGVSLSQVSSGISWWLNGCISANSGLVHSAAYPLTWSSTPINTQFVGAESNPTGNPIGGYYGYDRIVNPSDADYIIYTKEQFIDLFAQAPNEYHTQIVQPGDIIYIDDSAEINLTGEWGIFIPGNVTIASGRGRGFSKGALIFNHEQSYGPDAYGQTMFVTMGPYVRITGLRFEGPDKSTQSIRGNTIFFADRTNASIGGDLVLDNYYYMGVTTGISSRYAYMELDNCELSGWTAAIGLGEASPEFGGSVPMNGWGGSENTYIHHNYIHHNPHKGLGYAVNIGASNRPNEYSVTALVEANLFDFNRHSIASTSQQHSSYEARYNLVLAESIAVPFDRHGGGGLAGTHTIIHHNTCRYPKIGSACVGIGNPGYPPGISMAYNNWAYGVRVEEAFGNNDYPGEIQIFGNGISPLPASGVILPKPVISVDKDTINMGESIAFSASQSTGGSNLLSYVCWNFGDRSEEECGLASTMRNHVYSEPGRYLVTLKAVDVKGIFTETTKTIIIKPSSSNAVILSFWIRDSYNEHNTNDASGYFIKRVLVDNDVVWQRDINADGWGWEHVVIDITNYVEDESVVDFQVRSLQNYQRQNFPAYHPFDFFEVYLDDIYVFNAKYSDENFGIWEVDSLRDYATSDIQGFIESAGSNHMYSNGGETWWTGSVMYDDKSSGGYSYVISSGYRENSIAGATHGIKQTIKKVPTTLVDIQSDSTGTFKDYSGYLKSVSFAGTVDVSNNFVNDFFGYSKKFGANNYATVTGVDLSQNWILDMNVFLPYQNTPSTLMYANSGSNYVHIYYSPTNNVVVKTNSVETTCNLPQLTHTGFNKILVGRSCVGATCALSCASNGIVNSFSNPSATITMGGSSTVNFGGYNGGTNNLFGSINRAKLLQGSLQNGSFVNESKSWLQGAWYFRDGTSGVIQDGSLYNKDVTMPAGVNYGTDGARRFAHFSSSGPSITIPRDLSFRIGQEFSIEFVTRFNVLDGFNLVSGQPYSVEVYPYLSPGWPTDKKAHLFIKTVYSGELGDGSRFGVNGVRPTEILQENNWYHLVFTRDGDYLNAYINGVLNRKIYVPGVIYDNSVISDLIMGGFEGDVSRLAIYDKKLTLNEVEAKYAASSLGCSDGDNDGYGVFPRSGVVNGCRLNGFDCNDANAGVGSGGC